MEPTSQSPVPHEESSPGWTPQKFKAFAAELDGIANDVKRKLGREDVKYVKTVRRTALTAEVLGRALIHFSRTPLGFFLGVFALALHHQLETAEIGHPALHGCWDGLPGAEKFQSASFRWNCPVDEASWKREHNLLHHRFTNIAGKDPDLNFGYMRTTEAFPWAARHKKQVWQFFYSSPIFMWSIHFYTLGLVEFMLPERPESYAKILPDRSRKTRDNAVRQSLKKLIPYALYNFVLWPALAGRRWYKVLAANLVADVLRNVYTSASVYAGHFGDDLKYYEASFRPRSRGEWYKSQIEAAHDFKVPKPFSILCGALDYQVEHHIFPKFPPNRLRQIASRVQEACRRYGVAYHRANWLVNLRSALSRLIRMAKPPGFRSP